MTKHEIAVALSKNTGYSVKDFDVDSLLCCAGVRINEIQSVYVSNGYIIRLIMLPFFYPVLTDICTNLNGDLLVVRDFLKKKSKLCLVISQY